MEEIDLTRKPDHHAEEELGKYLDKYLYPKLKKFLEERCPGDKFEFVRETDRERQLNGIDVTLNITYKNGEKRTIYYDEKSQLYYMDKYINTFAFEIDSLQKGFVTDGWLFDETKLTDYYVLLYPKLCNKVLLNEYSKGYRKDKANVLLKISEADYDNVGCVIIGRKEIKKFLAEDNFGEAIVKDRAKKIRNRDIEPEDEKNKNNSRYIYHFRDARGEITYKYYMTYSYSIFEHPINVVIKKDILEEHSWYKEHWKLKTITRS